MPWVSEKDAGSRAERVSQSLWPVTSVAFLSSLLTVGSVIAVTSWYSFLTPRAAHSDTAVCYLG